MPNPKAPAEPDKDGAFKRASEFSDAMLTMPGYADDSMLFMIRYTTKAKGRLRGKDYSEFMKHFEEMCGMASKPAEEVGGLEARAQQVSQLRAAAIDKIKDQPDLVQEFDRFVTSTKAATRAMTGPES